MERDWGVEADLGTMVPDADANMRRWWAARARAAASPAAARLLILTNSEIDVRAVLPAIHVPTLVLHRSGDRDSHPDEGRYIAERIPGARFVELTGDVHVPWIDSDEIVDEVEEFLTGTRPAPQPERVLATVLFADIADSTARAAELGDRGWRELLLRHRDLVRRELARFNGREIDTAGDGFFATFDGPARAVRCAVSLVEQVRELGLQTRAGLHAGEIELMDGGAGGIAVHIGARVAAAARPGEVLVSGTVKGVVAGSGLAFDDRGEHQLKGVPGTWRLYAVSG
jgi:class 3 adenylate cyclase